MPAANSLHLPNLPAFCAPDFELDINRHCRTASELLQQWAATSDYLDDKENSVLESHRFGLLAALCYPTCDASQLQLVTQFLVVLAHWKTKEPSQVDKALDMIRSRLLSATHTKTWLSRFDAHLHASRIALARMNNPQPAGPVSVESYLENCQDSSGFMAAFDLTEYAEGLDLPEEVYNSPILTKLRINAINIVIWTVDIAAYALQQASGDAHNVLIVLREEKRFTPQGAMDLAAKLVKHTLDNFRANEKLLPSFGSRAVDADVRSYVRGLRAWIVGSIHWIYETERYFGKGRENVRAHGWMFMN